MDLAKKYGWRYTRYADDINLQLAEESQGASPILAR